MISISTQCLLSDPEDVYINYMLGIYMCNEIQINTVYTKMPKTETFQNEGFLPKKGCEYTCKVVETR